jgi:hypothetical protein
MKGDKFGQLVKRILRESDDTGSAPKLTDVMGTDTPAVSRPTRGSGSKRIPVKRMLELVQNIDFAKFQTPNSHLDYLYEGEMKEIADLMLGYSEIKSEELKEALKAKFSWASRNHPLAELVKREGSFNGPNKWDTIIEDEKLPFNSRGGMAKLPNLATNFNGDKVLRFPWTRSAKVNSRPIYTKEAPWHEGANEKLVHYHMSDIMHKEALCGFEIADAIKVGSAFVPHSYGFSSDWGGYRRSEKLGQRHSERYTPRLPQWDWNDANDKYDQSDENWDWRRKIGMPPVKEWPEWPRQLPSQIGLIELAWSEEFVGVYPGFISEMKEDHEHITDTLIKFLDHDVCYQYISKTPGDPYGQRQIAHEIWDTIRESPWKL